MPTITLTLAAGPAGRLFNALAARKGYNPATDGTKAQFADVVIKKILVDEVRAYERDRDAGIAGDAADALAQAEIVIT